MAAPAAPPRPEQFELLGADAAVTEHDWHAQAWQRMRRHVHGGTLQHLGLDAALAHPLAGRVLRAFAAQLRHEAERERLEQQRAARWGRRVEWTGYGTRPARPARRPR